MADPTSLPPGVERRKYVRYPASRAVSGHLITDDDRLIWTREVHDISAGGIAVVLDRSVPPGALLLLDLYGPRQLPLLCRFRVTHAEGRPGVFLVGGAFTRELAEAEVDELR